MSQTNGSQETPVEMAAEIDAATRKADVLEAVTGLRACVTLRDSLADAPA